MKSVDYLGILASLLGCWLLAAEAKAQPSAPLRSGEIPTTRTELVLGTLGMHAQSARPSLVAVLAAELQRNGLSLVEVTPVEPLALWASEVTRSERVLAVILLDARGEDGWRLVVIDAARGRAIARSLPAGRADAASIEAVVNIAVSAANALREGFEVASTPLVRVVGSATVVEALAPAPPPGRTRRALLQPPSQRRDAHWVGRAVVGGSVASFSPTAPTTPGIALALAVSFPPPVEARAFGAVFLPPMIRGPFGDFRVARAIFGGALGPVFSTGAFSFVPEAGVVAERTRRYDEVPAAGVFTTEAHAHYRVGGVLALRLRRRLIAPFSVELTTGAMYFGQGLQLRARGVDRSWSEGVWPAVAFVQLGLELATN